MLSVPMEHIGEQTRLRGSLGTLSSGFQAAWELGTVRNCSTRLRVSKESRPAGTVVTKERGRKAHVHFPSGKIPQVLLANLRI